MSSAAESAPETGPHDERQAAESFGSDPERYDRVRPRYPADLIDRIVAASPGGLILDVGVGTVLRPGGRLAVFWNTGRPPMGLEEAFAEVYRRVLSESLAGRLDRRSIKETHSAMCAKAVDGIRAAGAFEEPERWEFEWSQLYTRDGWLDALRTTGSAILEGQMAGLLEGVRDAIDDVGGCFTMNYVTFVITAVRRT